MDKLEQIKVKYEFDLVRIQSAFVCIHCTHM